MSFTHAGTYGPLPIQTDLGSPIPDLEVTVHPHGSPILAVLYTDRTKATTAANPTSTDANGNLTVYVDPGTYDLVGNGSTITVVVYPDPGDIAANAGFLPLTGGTMTGDIDMGGNTVHDVVHSTTAADTVAANLGDVREVHAGITTETERAEGVEATLLPLTGGTMTGDIDMGSNKITGLADGVTAQDALTVGQIPSSLPPNGTAGGDLGGAYPNPSVIRTTHIATTTGTYTVPVAGVYEITAVGGGGGGGGAGSSQVTTPVAQHGGSGGGAGSTVRQVVDLAATAVLTVTIGAGGAAGTGGIAGSGGTSHAGTNGSSGSPTTVTGGGVSLFAQGGGLGTASLANSTAVANGGAWGLPTPAGETTTRIGGGGPSGASGGSPVGSSGGGGGGGGAATTGSIAKGGAGGGGGSLGASAAAGGSGASASVTGMAGSAGSSPGAGGGGGGGGAATSGGSAGKGGNGGAGAAGIVYIVRVG